MICEKCGTNIAPGQQSCPNCGAVCIQAPKTKEISFAIHMVLGLLIFGVIAGIAVLLVSSRVHYQEQELTDKETIQTSLRVEVTSPYTETVDISVSSEMAPAVSQTQQDEREEDSEYIFPDSNERYLEEEEIYALDKDEMRIARNEIYARLGRKFTDESLQEYFDSKSWYEPLYTAEEFDAFGDHIFNEFEFYNKNLIADIEQELGYR